MIVVLAYLDIPNDDVRVVSAHSFIAQLPKP
jgi:hypothetical protein